MSKAEEPKEVASALAYQITVGADSYIAELEKENAELKNGLGCETCQIHLEYMRLNDKIRELEQKLEQTEKDLAEYQFNYPTIKELTEGTCFAHLKSLEKENAELKEKLNFRTQYYQGEKAKEQLTKAKEIIREIIKYEIPTLDYEKAEQFLKEIKE